MFKLFIQDIFASKTDQTKIKNKMQSRRMEKHNTLGRPETHRLIAERRVRLNTRKAAKNEQQRPDQGSEETSRKGELEGGRKVQRRIMTVEQDIMWKKS